MEARSLRRNEHERVCIPLSRWRGWSIPRTNAADDAEMDGLVQGACRSRSCHRPGPTLERAGKLVKGSKKAVTDGPFAEAKDIIGGFTLIEARDLDQATELSKGCPILEVEGSVEVRPVMKLNM